MVARPPKAPRHDAQQGGLDAIPGPEFPTVGSDREAILDKLHDAARRAIIILAALTVCTQQFLAGAPDF